MSGPRSINPTLRSTLALSIAAILLNGCGGSGPHRYAVSGKITHEGKSVPFGFVRFEPDAAKGNSGPGAGAQVKDGAFSTESGKGIVGGPHVVTVYATDGIATKIDGEDAPQGKPLFPDFKTQVEFPKENFEWNFDVPRAGNIRSDAR